MANANNCNQILADIRARRFAPIYILSGEEPYFLDLIADTLLQFSLQEYERDFNQHIFYGQDVDLDLLINTARQYPVMAEHKLVMLREAQAMTQARIRLDKLEEYCSKPSPSTILVIHFKGEPLRDTSKLLKASKKTGAVIFTAPKTRDYMLASHVRDYCKGHNITIEPRAAEMLCQNIGANLQLLFGEIEKLRLALPKGESISITADMVAANIGVSKQYNSFELKSAIMHRDYNTSMCIAQHFAANPNAKESSPEQTAATIFGAFANLLTAHYLQDRSDDAIKRDLKLNFRPQIEELRAGLKNYSAWSCMRAIHAIRQYDRNIKGIGSAQVRTDLLTELIYKLFTL